MVGGVLVEGGAIVSWWWEESLSRMEPELVGEAVNLGDSLKETGLLCFRPMKIWKRKL